MNTYRENGRRNYGDDIERDPTDDELLAEVEEELTPEILPELLRKDLREAASLLGIQEVKYLVSMYYQFQEQRKASSNRVRTLGSQGAPLNFLTWMKNEMVTLEDTIKKVLDYYTLVEPTGMGQWARSIHGIGPVITAGLLAHIDVTKAPTAGHVWSFAGLDPNVVWGKGQRRPWNADLKVLCWKAGESFVKSSGSEKSYYGRLYKERKLYEIERNDAGGNAEAAKNILATKNFRDETVAKAWYLQGKLPPAHIHARASRWAVKLFLAHFWEESYRRHFSVEPPLPYPIAFLQHVHRIGPPPNVSTLAVPQGHPQHFLQASGKKLAAQEDGESGNESGGKEVS